MGGIREFNCACLIVSLVLALLLNTFLSFTLPCIICLVFYMDIPGIQNTAFYLSAFVLIYSPH